MKDLLNELFRQLASRNSPIVPLLLKGLDPQTIDSKISNFGFKLPKELYDLYSWKNGVKGDDQKTWKLGELYLFNLGIYRPLTESLDIYEKCSGKIWSEELFPLFESGGGDYYLINCKESSSAYGEIFYFSPSEIEFTGVISIYDSLQTLIQTIIECYSTNIYYYSENSSFLEIADKLERGVAIRYNPKSAYWKLQ